MNYKWILFYIVFAMSILLILNSTFLGLLVFLISGFMYDKLKKDDKLREENTKCQT